ncbi:hypothetical protein [Salinivibrio sp. ML290]|uniref:hypothetical protein n=1 Tax=Salinivibrio sp. ML290 TaxID=1909468 RepID=UPI000988430C|nr:hypothetical protein [Salinivibrio sp. ML290]OOE74688.1 hypothetical protein BZG23_08665 [Salinivibrio sp. ML290]
MATMITKYVDSVDAIACVLVKWRGFIASQMRGDDESTAGSRFNCGFFAQDQNSFGKRNWHRRMKDMMTGLCVRNLLPHAMRLINNTINMNNSHFYS